MALEGAVVVVAGCIPADRQIEKGGVHFLGNPLRVFLYESSD